MGSWVLIIFVLGGYKAAATSVPFWTKEACVAVAKQYNAQVIAGNGGSGVATAQCFETGYSASADRLDMGVAK